LYCGPVPCRWCTRCHSFPYRSAGKGAPYWGSNHREGSAIAELEVPLSLSCRPKYPWRASVAPFPPRYASAALSTVCPPGTTIKVIKVWTRLYNRSVRPSFFRGPLFCPIHSTRPHRQVSLLSRTFRILTGFLWGEPGPHFFVVCGVCGATLISVFLASFVGLRALYGGRTRGVPCSSRIACLGRSLRFAGSTGSEPLCIPCCLRVPWADLCGFAGATGAELPDLPHLLLFSENYPQRPFAGR